MIIAKKIVLGSLVGLIASFLAVTVVVADVPNNSVTSAKIVNGAVTSADLATGAINTLKIKNYTIRGIDIAPGNITSAAIKDGTVTGVDIAADTITAADIAADAVGTSELAADSVTTAEIAADTIVAGDIATGAVTTTEILDGTIATADIEDGAITGGVGGVVSDDSLTADDIAAGAVTTSEILDGTILVGDFATGAVDSAAILNDSIVNADVNTTAAIAGTKISPDFGSQAITTSGTSSLTGGTVVDSGLLSLGTISPAVKLDVSANTGRVAGLQINLLNTAGSVTGFRGIDSRVTDNGTAAFTVGVQGVTTKESGVSTAEGWGGNFVLKMTGGQYENVWGVVGDVTVGATSSVGSASNPAINNLNAGLFQSYVDTGATLSSVMIDAPILANIKGGANNRAKADAGVMVMLSVLP
ncbi:hypothetical protein IID23_04125, partial [Patescibacteria group bacterium]|nr:hypothetical protein [Patescibacteria group bacterium]